MRGSMFVATAWGRHPLRPYSPVRMGQDVVCDGDVCRMEPPAAAVPSSPAPTTTPPTSNEFPIVPVAIGAGALILVAALL